LDKEQFDRFKRAVTRLEKASSDSRFSPSSVADIANNGAAADYEEQVRAPLRELVRLFPSTDDVHFALRRDYTRFVPPAFLSEYRTSAGLQHARTEARGFTTGTLPPNKKRNFV
jgi:hypothetical protein